MIPSHPAPPRYFRPARRGLLLGLAAATGSSWAQPASSDSLKAAVDAAHRSAANRARDPWRHPYETLRFLGIEPQHRVIEIAPGAGWYTEILAPYLHARGALYAAHYARDDAQEYRRKGRAAFEAKLAAEPAIYGRVKVGVLPVGSSFPDIRIAGGADAVLTFRNVHNWIADGHLDETLRAFHGVLKPGGILGVEEHRAPAGASLGQIIESGYVTEDFLIERARAAGFTLAARSEINANPRDTRNHPNGVWSLPPTLRGGEVDRARFVAIGESDRFTHRYIKG